MCMKKKTDRTNRRPPDALPPMRARAFRMPDALWLALKEEAARQNRTVSNLVLTTLLELVAGKRGKR